jgi:hypothetical protein
MSEDNKSAEDKPTISNFSAIEYICNAPIQSSSDLQRHTQDGLGISMYCYLRRLDVFPCTFMSKTHGAVENVICDYLDSNLNLQQW